MLLERVCKDAQEEGFEILEHILIESIVTNRLILAVMLRCIKCGFELYLDTGKE